MPYFTLDADILLRSARDIVLSKDKQSIAISGASPSYAKQSNSYSHSWFRYSNDGTQYGPFDIRVLECYAQRPSMVTGKQLPGGWLFPTARGTTIEARELSRNEGTAFFDGGDTYVGHLVQESVTKLLLDQMVSKLFSHSALANVRNKSIIKAEAKVGSADFSAGLNLATLGQTSKHLAHSLIELAQLVRAIRRLDVKAISKYGKDVPRFSKEVSKRWLEAEYAWKPLVSDIQEAIEFIQSELPVDTMAMRTQANPYADVRLSVSTPSGAFNPTLEFDGRVGHRAVYWFDVINDYKAWLRRLGLNPLGIAWDLIPFSFIVDWVFSMGTVCDSLMAGAGTDFLSGTHTSWIKGGLLERPVPTSNDMVYSTYRTLSLRCYQRRTVTDWPKAGIFYKNPFIYKGHIASVAALVRGFLSH